jgi:hypothetical protein
MQTFNSESLIDAQNTPVLNIFEAISSNEPSNRLEELTQNQSSVVDNIAKSDQQDKDFNTKRFLSKSIGITLAGSAVVALIYELLIRKANNKPTNDLSSIPEDVSDQIEQLVTKWIDQPDSTFWQSLANEVNDPSDTILTTAADQILFMNYTIQLSPASQAWLWNKTQDKADMVDQLIQIYNDNSESTAAMYSAVTSLTYNNLTMPRSTTADVLRSMNRYPAQLTRSCGRWYRPEMAACTMRFPISTTIHISKWMAGSTCLC